MDTLSLKLENKNINYAIALLDMNMNSKPKILERVWGYCFKNKKLKMRIKTKILGLVPFINEESKNKYLESINNTNLLAINVNIVH